MELSYHSFLPGGLLGSTELDSSGREVSAGDGVRASPAARHRLIVSHDRSFPRRGCSSLWGGAMRLRKKVMSDPRVCSYHWTGLFLAVMDSAQQGPGLVNSQDLSGMSGRRGRVSGYERRDRKLPPCSGTLWFRWPFDHL